MERRIGVYICECGPNIADAVDIDRVIEAVSPLDGVVVADKHKLLCSPDGKKFIPDQIREHNLTHLVIGACSPKQHESTFMTACIDGELNPFMFQMANIREHVAWITPDKDKATERSIRHVQAAINRVCGHTPLEIKELECNPDVLIIGGGIAGITAAQLLGSPGRKVYIVEKEGKLGGKVAAYEKVFPDMAKGSDLTETSLKIVEENENIEVMTDSEVTEVLGYLGNFVVTVNRNNQETDSLILEVGAILTSPGMSLNNPESIAAYGYGSFGEVYTAFEIEEMNLSGKITMKNGQEPKSVGIIHCVGRKDIGYCSQVCCQVSMKIARNLIEKIPGVDVTAFYQDLSIPGSGSQEFFEETKKGGAAYVCADTVKISKSKSALKILYGQDGVTTDEKTVDMVVLMSAIKPAGDSAKLSEILNIPLGDKGFFTEEHEIISQVNTTIQGIYLSGCASGPKGIPETVVQSEAVAGKILSTLVPGRKLETEAKTSKISEELCTACKICLTVCCYSAISYDEIKEACVVNDVLCKGCGNCAAACLSGAAVHQHFTSGQIYRELAEILK